MNIDKLLQKLFIYEFFILCLYITLTLILIIIQFSHFFTYKKLFQIFFIILLIIFRFKSKDEIRFIPDIMLFSLPLFWGFEIQGLYNSIWQDYKIWFYLYLLILAIIIINYISDAKYVSHFQNYQFFGPELSIIISVMFVFLQALVLSIVFPFFELELFIKISKITHLYVGNLVIIKSFLIHLYNKGVLKKT